MPLEFIEVSRAFALLLLVSDVAEMWSVGSFYSAVFFKKAEKISPSAPFRFLNSLRSLPHRKRNVCTFECATKRPFEPTASIVQL